MKIYNINHGNTKSDRNSYCGPAIISALTRCTTAEASTLIRKYNRKKRIIGTNIIDLKKPLEEFNLHTSINITPKPHIKLGKWLRDSSNQRNINTVYLIAADNHWLLIHQNKYVCGQLGRVVSINHDEVRIGAVVTEVYEITTPSRIKTVAQVLPKRNTKSNPYYAKSKSMIKKYPRLYYEKERFGWGSETYYKYYVACDDISEADDPFRGEHYVDRDDAIDNIDLWRQIHERLTAYVELLNQGK